MSENIFRTNFSNEEIKEAVNNFIKVKKKRVNEFYNNTFEINKSNKNCWYCNSNGNLKKSKYQFGYYCSDLCDEIYYGNIYNIFNYVNKPYVDMIPFKLILNKESLLGLIKETKKYTGKLKGYLFKKDIDYFFNIEIFDDKLCETIFKDIIKIEVIDKNILCINCDDEIKVNSHKVQICNKEISFCSFFCKSVYHKIIERYLKSDTHINLYLPPINFFNSKDDYRSIINNQENISGGLDNFDSNKFTIILYSN